jgi:uncharacterized protein HemX
MRKQLKEEETDEETDEETTTTRSPYTSYHTVLVTLIITILILLSTAIWQHTREPKKKQQTATTEAAKETDDPSEDDPPPNNNLPTNDDEEEESGTNGWIIGVTLLGIGLAIVAVYMVVNLTKKTRGKIIQVVETPVQLLEKEKEALLEEEAKWKKKAEGFEREVKVLLDAKRKWKKKAEGFEKGVMRVKKSWTMTDAEEKLDAEIQKETLRLDGEYLDLKKKLRTEIRKEKDKERKAAFKEMHRKLTSFKGEG